MTGDLICSSPTTASSAKQRMEKKFGLSSEEASREIGERNRIPDPVFFCTVEPNSQVKENTHLSYSKRSIMKIREPKISVGKFSTI